MWLVGAGRPALVVWGVYGPLASYDLVAGTTIELHLTVCSASDIALFVGVDTVVVKFLH